MAGSSGRPAYRRAFGARAGQWRTRGSPERADLHARALRGAERAWAVAVLQRVVQPAGLAGSAHCFRPGRRGTARHPAWRAFNVGHLSSSLVVGGAQWVDQPAAQHSAPVWAVASRGGSSGCLDMHSLSKLLSGLCLGRAWRVVQLAVSHVSAICRASCSGGERRGHPAGQITLAPPVLSLCSRVQAGPPAGDVRWAV